FLRSFICFMLSDRFYLSDFLILQVCEIELSFPKILKLDRENRIFQTKWEEEYLFTEFKGKPMCLVCLETLSALKDYNLSRHYSTLHKVKYEKYTGAARAAVVADLKSKVGKQQHFFTKATTSQESAITASYDVALELARAKKPLSDGEVVKRCAVKMAKAFGDNNIAKNFETVSLSRRTVTRRIFDIHGHVHVKMKQVMQDCQYFSLALDESTDVTDVSQLLVFARTIDNAFDVHRELLKLASLHDTTKGSDIFNRRYQCCWVNMVALKTLCAKTLNFGHVMDLVTKVTNIIRGGNRSLCHRRFITFLDEVDAEYGDLQLHTDIRWMSRIPVFLENSISSDTRAYCVKLKDTQFLCDMAFLTDISTHLNHLNTLLQGKDQTVCDLYSHMTAFQRKLGLFIDGFPSPHANLAHFPEQFNDRFQDFHEMQPRIALFTDPLSAVVSAQPSELQLELCELQADPFFQSKRNERGISFWRLLPEARFPRLRDFALSMASMFGSTYIYESSFSTMKHIKSKERNRLTDDTLFHLMRIGTTKINIDIQSMVSQQAKPQLSH
uniref:SPIN-DOC-like zinc-finger domain-containing protein n=1 Tax=Astyanax mexicanus TaxID=7994 RepID=A0A3B1JTT5_ASTMX